MKTILFLLLLLLNLGLEADAAIDLNSATQSELEQLNGIGPTKAKAIVDYRKQHGNFKRIQELENVNGIGEATVKKLRDQIIIHRSTSKPALELNNTPANRKGPLQQTIKTDRPAKRPDVRD